RVGPPIIQPFYDIVKLFGKKKSDSKGQKSILFRLVPFLYFISTYALFLFILGIVKFQFDFILFIYIIILSSAMYILLGLVANSPFGAFGSMRDMLLMICYEIALTVCVFSFVVYSDVLSLSQLNESWLILKLSLASLCMIVVALVETRITPFDTAEAETEIMGSVETEYSGKSLGFIELSRQLRLLFFILLLIKFLFNPATGISFILFFILMFFILLFSEVTTARYRTDQTFNVLLFVLTLSVIEFIRLYFWVL
ncbi:MAG: NADH-quinone oxidoreductase subunit H, partial [Candidatus Aenigmarchaeota archaeon]|nr:NADH-quinone oxidoreductase subunit H [Candidatus Aenigmarchaeota archaeon]